MFKSYNYNLSVSNKFEITLLPSISFQDITPYGKEFELPAHNWDKV